MPGAPRGARRCDRRRPHPWGAAVGGKASSRPTRRGAAVRAGLRPPPWAGLLALFTCFLGVLSQRHGPRGAATPRRPPIPATAASASTVATPAALPDSQPAAPPADATAQSAAEGAPTDAAGAKAEDERFERAVAVARKLPSSLPNESMLRLYGTYKQAGGKDAPTQPPSRMQSSHAPSGARGRAARRAAARGPRALLHAGRAAQWRASPPPTLPPEPDTSSVLLTTLWIVVWLERCSPTAPGA